MCMDGCMDLHACVYEGLFIGEWTVNVFHHRVIHLGEVRQSTCCVDVFVITKRCQGTPSTWDVQLAPEKATSKHARALVSPFCTNATAFAEMLYCGGTILLACSVEPRIASLYYQ